MHDDLDVHYNTMIKAMTDGRVVPFLGAGVNLFDRPPGTTMKPGQYLPSGSELAKYLADYSSYSPSEAQVRCPSCHSEVHLAEKIQDLVRVAQYTFVMLGSGPLYSGLRSVFDADYPFTPLHLLFAALPAMLREKGYPPRYQLIVTTNYDDVLERAFQEADEPFDLVFYVADGENRGKFWHRLPSGQVHLIDRPNEYGDLSLDKRTVILKIHGTADRTDEERDSYVITEDHYIDYLTHTDISNLIPVKLAAKLRKSHFLFLGYSLRDWNLRVILHRIWGERKLTYKSWAIQLHPDALDQKFWMTRDIDILNASLEGCIAALGERVQALPRVGGAL